MNGASSLVRAAVVVVGREAAQRGGFTAAERAQFGHGGEQRRRSHRADPFHFLEAFALAVQRGVVGDLRGDQTVQLFELLDQRLAQESERGQPDPFARADPVRSCGAAKSAAANASADLPPGAKSPTSGP